MFYASDKAKKTDGMDGNINNINLFFDMPENLTTEQVAKMIATVEDTVKTKSEVYNYERVLNFSCAVLVIFLQKAVCRCMPELERGELSISSAASDSMPDTRND